MKQVISVQFQRKRKRLTNYRSRLKLLSSGSNRLVIRKTTHYILTQIVSYSDKGDLVIVSTNSKALKKYGWNLSFKNIPSAYLIGFALGKQALKKGVKKAILDAGTSKPCVKGRIYAAMKGVIDAGLDIPGSSSIFPGDDRISGKHIASYLKSQSSTTQFSTYKKNNVNDISLQELIKSVKNKISGDKV